MIDHAGEILVLTGAPGSGKTTTATLLAAQAGSPKVHLHADDFWHFIRHGAIAPYLPEARAQNAVVMDVLANAAAGYARGGYFVVVDGIVGPWFLSPFEALEAPLHYMVLRAPLELAIKRCRTRGGDALSDPEPIAALHRQFSDLGELERHAIAVGDGSPEQQADLVVDRLDSGAHRLARRRAG